MDQLTPQPIENLRRLERLAEDHRRLFGLRQPLTAAILVALTQDSDAILARDPANQPEEAVPAIVAVAEAVVRKAIRGDSTAFAHIAERIEGKVGMRQGEQDADLDRHRATVEATIEGVVEAMTRRRTMPANDATLIESTPSVVVTTDPGLIESERGAGALTVNPVDSTE